MKILAPSGSSEDGHDVIKIAGIGIFVDIKHLWPASSVLENKSRRNCCMEPLRMRQQMVDKKRNDMMLG